MPCTIIVCIINFATYGSEHNFKRNRGKPHIAVCDRNQVFYPVILVDKGLGFAPPSQGLGMSAWQLALDVPGK